VESLQTKQRGNEYFEKASGLEEEVKVYKGAQQKRLSKPRSREQVGEKDTQEGIAIYLAIEKRIPKYWREKQEGKVKQTPYTEKSGVSVIDRAIEDVIAGKNLESFEEENKLKQQYKDTYYRIAERYMLPTLRELPNYLKLFDEVAS